LIKKSGITKFLYETSWSYSIFKNFGTAFKRMFWNNFLFIDSLVFPLINHAKRDVGSLIKKGTLCFSILWVSRAPYSDSKIRNISTCFWMLYGIFMQFWF